MQSSKRWDDEQFRDYYYGVLVLTSQYNHLKISRKFLEFIRDMGHGKVDRLWINNNGEPVYLRIEAHKFPEAFGGITGYKVSFCTPNSSGIAHFGSIFPMVYWINKRYGIVSVP